MQSWTRMCAVIAVLMLALVGCTRQVAGVAQPDPIKPGVEVTADGHGIRVGLPDAPVQFEIYTEPQCSHCADFQARFGEDIKSHIQSGLLTVVYRPLTFLDEEFFTDYSEVAVNALFLSVGPTTSASTFQSFVENLWAHQGLADEDFTNGDFADLARESGIAPELVAKIGDGAHAVDAFALNDDNYPSLADLSSGSPGTPTVYDLKRKEVVDIADADWLKLVMRPA
jgi:hypothetical protein